MKKIKTINDRLKYLRKEILKLGQVEFSKKINLKSSGFISQLEKGTRNITDRTINDICREFNVNEEWLRAGIGEVFQENDDTILSELIKEKNITNDLVIQVLKNFMDLDHKKQVELVMLAKELFKDNNNETSEELSLEEKLAQYEFIDLSDEDYEHNKKAINKDSLN